MGREKWSKINQLITTWPDGVVHTTDWLNANGYTDQHLQKYRNSSWINSIGKSGAYKKQGDTVDWTGGLQALQCELQLPIYVAGKSALALAGKAHYLNLGTETVLLLGPPKQHLPKWFSNGPWTAKIEYRTKRLFAFSDQTTRNKNAIGLTDRKEGSVTFAISSPERAILEYLDDVPARATYDEGDKLIEGLTNLRSGLLQNLLEACTSIKVKRLFLHFAEKTKPPWLKRLKRNQIDLGSGKRVIIKNGSLDPNYLITIPRNTDRHEKV